MQHALDAVGRGARVGQAGHHLRKLRNRRHPNLVPIEKRVDQGRERLFRGVVAGVFQAAGEQQVLDHRAARVRRRRLVVLLQNLVDFGELGGAADGGHGDGSLRSWSADPGSIGGDGVSRLARRPNGLFLRENLLQDLGHGDRSLDPLIQQKTQLGRVADVDALGDFRLQETGGALQAAERQFLAALRRPSPKRGLWRTQVGRHLDVRDRNVADPGSFSSAKIAMLTTSRMASAAFSVRRDDMEVVVVASG